MTSVETGAGLRELVVCSLEAWDEVWRRNQFFVDILLRRNPSLRVLFVEPPADVLHDLSQQRPPQMPKLRRISGDGRLRALRPLKVLPRRLGSLADTLLLRQVGFAARAAGFSRPILWINDVTYAPLIRSTGWPSVYDVTDDWLLAPFPPRELDRLRRLDALALAQAREVVTCSERLASSRGLERTVTVIPNAVDADHFQRPRTRPHDLPSPPTAVYVGSLHDARIDVDLVAELALTLPYLNLTFVGPNSLSAQSQERLAALQNVHLLGQREYDHVPAYVQHADVLVVPHRVSPFTDSLDPIKAYECLCVATPTVATPIAGFVEHGDVFTIASRAKFASRVASVLSDAAVRLPHRRPATWKDRATAFEAVLKKADAGDA